MEVLVMYEETFGQRLSRIRKEKGLTQEDIAKKIVISPQAVSKWENDVSSPDILVLSSLADILGVSVDVLLGRKDFNPEDVKEEKPEKEEEESVEADKDTSDVYDKVFIEDDGDEIHIGKGGVHIKDHNGDDVRIGKDGVFVNGERKGSAHIRVIKSAISSILFGLALLSFILLGVLWKDGNMGWKCGWISFLAAISIDSIFKCIRKKRFSEFAYPIFITGLYCLLGFLGDHYGFRGWDFYWFLFITIPVFYIIFKPIDRLTGHLNDDD